MRHRGQPGQIAQPDAVAERRHRTARHLALFKDIGQQVFLTEQALKPGQQAVVLRPVKLIRAGDELIQRHMA